MTARSDTQGFLRRYGILCYPNIKDSDYRFLSNEDLVNLTKYVAIHGELDGKARKEGLELAHKLRAITEMSKKGVLNEC